jgi:hypothetical protein
VVGGVAFPRAPMSGARRRVGTRFWALVSPLAAQGQRMALAWVGIPRQRSEAGGQGLGNSRGRGALDHERVPPRWPVMRFLPTFFKRRGTWLGQRLPHRVEAFIHG